MAHLGEVVHVDLIHLSLSSPPNRFGCYFVFNISINLLVFPRLICYYILSMLLRKGICMIDNKGLLLYFKYAALQGHRHDRQDNKVLV